MALREAALAIGEPPATKGYPPSVFAALPRLLERAGTAGGAGMITALYTVLVEGDDLSDPVADATRSILDGHIVLTRSLADRGHFPAIDVLGSVSRLAGALSTPEQLRSMSVVRDMMATYRSALDLIQVGAYVEGSDPKVDAACRAMPQVDAFLRQGLVERSSFEEAAVRVQRLAILSGAQR
jgi:flagellar biosynthesis/type III secretory pathway ATPase